MDPTRGSESGRKQFRAFESSCSEEVGSILRDENGGCAVEETADEHLIGTSHEMGSVVCEEGMS